MIWLTYSKNIISNTIRIRTYYETIYKRKSRQRIIRWLGKGSKAFTIVALVFLIGKKDGGARMVIDYWQLNKITESIHI